MFDQLLRRRVSFNAYTYNCLLQLCCSAGRMDDALAVYNLQVRCGAVSERAVSIVKCKVQDSLIIDGKVCVTA